MCKRGIKSFVLLLLSVLLWLAAGTGTQAAQMYQITPEELTQLESGLNQLKADNEKKTQLLAMQRTQLETANSQMAKLRALNEMTQESLQNVKASLTVLEQEERRKMKIKNRQRDFWIGASAILLYAYIRK